MRLSIACVVLLSRGNQRARVLDLAFNELNTAFFTP